MGFTVGAAHRNPPDRAGEEADDDWGNIADQVIHLRLPTRAKPPLSSAADAKRRASSVGSRRRPAGEAVEPQLD
jgi:hypothetical protein